MDFVGWYSVCVVVFFVWLVCVLLYARVWSFLVGFCTLAYFLWCCLVVEMGSWCVVVLDLGTGVKRCVLLSSWCFLCCVCAWWFLSGFGCVFM